MARGDKILHTNISKEIELFGYICEDYDLSSKAYYYLDNINKKFQINCLRIPTENETICFINHETLIFTNNSSKYKSKCKSLFLIKKTREGYTIKTDIKYNNIIENISNDMDIVEVAIDMFIHIKLSELEERFNKLDSPQYKKSYSPSLLEELFQLKSELNSIKKIKNNKKVNELINLIDEKINRLKISYSFMSNILNIFVLFFSYLVIPFTLIQLGYNYIYKFIVSNNIINYLLIFVIIYIFVLLYFIIGFIFLVLMEKIYILNVLPNKKLLITIIIYSLLLTIVLALNTLLLM